MRIINVVLSGAALLVASGAVPAWSQSRDEVPPAERSAPTPARPTPGAQARPRPAAPLPNGVVVDNGPLVTHPGGGAGGADASRLQNSTLLMSTLGFTASTAGAFRIADDFTVPASGWSLNTITFFAYQTGSTTTSTFNDVRVQIWDGPPNAGGSVIFGDTTTNRFSGTAFSGIYRDTETTVANNQRPIMSITATVPVVLAAGTYWVDFQVGGTLASGPFVPPTTVLGQTSGCSPGPCNALQWSGTAWAGVIDTGASAVQDVRFTIDTAAAAAADLAITKTDGQTTYYPGQSLAYTLTVSNAGPNAAAGAQVVDSFPVDLSGVTWTCSASAGSSCASPSGSGNLDTTVSLLAGGTATYVVSASTSIAAPGSITNTATVSAAPGLLDPNMGDNSATDTDTRVGGSYYSVTPCRVFDTRNPAGPLGGPALSAGVARSFPIAGNCGIPANATAATVNLTVTNPTALGNLRVFPTGAAMPLASAINYAAGQTRANNGVYVLGAGGEIDVACKQASGTADMILDVTGYFVE